MQAVARAERLFVVPAGAFHPRPKVDSAVLRLTPLHPPLVTDAELPTFRRMTVGLFGFRRKQLGRGLRELTGWTPERVAEALARAAIDPLGPAGDPDARGVRPAASAYSLTGDGPGSSFCEMFHNWVSHA